MSYPGESQEYTEARRYVLQLEIGARRALEEAAAARRRLPPGPLAKEDYVFEEMIDGAVRKVKLSELFQTGRPSLAIYSWMFNEKMKRPCPMCTAMIDSWDGIVRHVSQRLPLVIVADSPIARLMQFKKDHGWKNLRILSTADSNYNRDYKGVDENGNAIPNINIFKRTGEQTDAGIQHFYGGEMMEMKADVGQDPRGLDTLNPIFQFFDLAPEGRGDFYTKLEYPTRSSL